MNVPVVIQHHPSRAHLLPALLERLAPLPVQVVADPQPDAVVRSAWRTYHACLEAFPDDASHALIVQDDVTTCRDLAATLPAVVESAQAFTDDDPLICLSLFHEVSPEQRAVIERAWRYRTQSPKFLKPPPEWFRYLPLVATIWPRAARDAFLAVAPSPYMGHGTLPGAPNPPLIRKEGHAFVFIEVDDENALDSSAFTTELGRLHVHDDVVVFDHRDVLPPFVGTMPALVSHLVRESVVQRGRLRDEPTVMYAGDDFSALEVFPTRAEVLSVS